MRKTAVSLRHWYFSLCMGGIWAAGWIYFSSLHVSDIHVSIIRRKIALSLCYWYLSLCMCDVWSAAWIEIQPADQTPSIQSDKYQWHKDTAIFLLMMGTWMPETCREER